MDCCLVNITLLKHPELFYFNLNTVTIDSSSRGKVMFVIIMLEKLILVNYPAKLNIIKLISV